MAELRPFPPERAETTALTALGWLAREERLEAFAASAGIDAGEVAGMASDPGFLGAVLDFVMSDEALARGFATEEGLAPEDLARARAALPGGDQHHWT